MKWSTIIRCYKMHHRPHSQTQLNWFREQPALDDAIILAANAKNERGLRYSHQARITRKAIKQAKAILLENSDALQKCSSFHELWLLIRRAIEPIYGIGELYIYDASFRIGAYLNLLPDKVYLHAGTRKGAKAFGLLSQSREWIELGELPTDLQCLPPHEIEDVLCIYKNRQISHKGCANQKICISACGANSHKQK